MSEIIIVAIIGACSSILVGVITALVTLKIAGKSQLKENTSSIEKLSQQLNSQYKIISEDIGRNDGASLSKQHTQITKCIEEKYRTIEARYEKEDKAYRAFNNQQRDLKQTMDNFIRDYTETINSENELMNENAELRNENEALALQIKELKQKNQKLSNQINELTVELENERNSEDEQER